MALVDFICNLQNLQQNFLLENNSIFQMSLKALPLEGILRASKSSKRRSHLVLLNIWPMSIKVSQVKPQGHEETIS